MALKRHHDFDAELGRSDGESIRYKTHEGKAQTRSAPRVGTQARALIDHRNSDRVVLGPRSRLGSSRSCCRCTRGTTAFATASDDRQRDLLPVGAVTGGEFRDRLSRRGNRRGRGRKLDLVPHLLSDHCAGPFAVACRLLRPPWALSVHLPPFGGVNWPLALWRLGAGAVTARTRLRAPTRIR